MVINKRNNNKGFTLIEVLVATSIFVLTMMVLSQIFISVIRSEKLAYALLDTENIIRNNLEYMARAIRMGTKFSSPDNSQICFTNSRGQEQCFQFQGESLVEILDGNSNFLIDASQSLVKIKEGTFYLYYPNSTTNQPIVRIQIWAQTEVRGQNYDFKVETAVTPRTLNINP
jgi:prepilin-type N-terminal cleavage/methylation domain-containing protein